MIAPVALVSALVLGAQGIADTAPLTLVLNLPALRLEVHEAGWPVERFSVAIGSPGHPTPVGAFAVIALELNPAWTPPESPWAAGKAEMPPGPANPMGRAKLMFKPLYFIHGTPDTASIGLAQSHGCVRLRNADVLKLAARVLTAGMPRLDSVQRKQWLESSATRTVRLLRAIPTHVRYDLLEISDGHVTAYPDVYRLRSAVTDSSAEGAVARAIAPHRAIPGIVQQLLDSARNGPVTVPLDRVVAK